MKWRTQHRMCESVSADSNEAEVTRRTNDGMTDERQKEGLHISEPDRG